MTITPSPMASLSLPSTAGSYYKHCAVGSHAHLQEICWKVLAALRNVECAGAKPLKNNRFSAEYKQEYDTWTGFWDKQQVPEQQDVPELRARLAHLLGLGAGWVMISCHDLCC